MTRLEFGSDKKSNDAQDEKKQTEEKATEFVIAEIDLIGEKLENDDEAKVKSEPSVPAKTMDWIFVRRISLAQIVLAMLSMTCVLSSLIVGGITWFKFATFFWSTFVLLCGYAGYKSYSTKNYYYVLTYLIMAAFQSLTNWFALVYSTYAVYYFESREIRYYKGYCLGVSYRDMALFLELTESITMMGTVITGILGAKACCAGLGRLLTYQDQLIQKRSAWQ